MDATLDFYSYIQTYLESIIHDPPMGIIDTDKGVISSKVCRIEPSKYSNNLLVNCDLLTIQFGVPYSTVMYLVRWFRGSHPRFTPTVTSTYCD